MPWPCGDAPVVALMRPSRSMVTCECSQPPVGSDELGPRPHTSTYIASPRPTSRPSFAGRVALGDQRVPVRRLQRAGRAPCRSRRSRRPRPSASRYGNWSDWMKFLRRSSAGIHLQLAREHVHRALDEVGRLGTAGAAVGVGRRLVREDLGERRADGRDVVGAVGHQHRQRRDRRRQQHVVGADVGDQPHLQAEHLAVSRRGDVDVADDVAPVRGRDERFRSILDPLDRDAQPLRDRGRTYSSP